MAIYDTDERLKSYLDSNQLARERVCLAVLAIDKRFSGVRPRHPRGGPDGNRDIDAVYLGSDTAFGAVGFLNQANDSDEQRKRSRQKFDDDLEAALGEQKISVFVFFTNVNLTLAEKDELKARAHSRGVTYCDILDRERLRIILDSPDGFSIRFQYLNIPLSEAEQATFFAKWGDDIQSVISVGFSRLEKTLNRLHFLAETQMPLGHLTVILELNREYTGEEIGHFRAFCSLELVEPRDRVVGLLFGSTDNSSRLDVADKNKLNPAASGVLRGRCGRQWKERLREGEDIPDPFTKTREYLTPTGSFTAVGLQRAGKLAIQFDGASSFLRMPPYLLLRDIDEATFALFLNRSLAEKLATVRVLANEYELASYARKELRIDEPYANFGIPMCFTEEELADTWVRVMHDLSPFRISFSDTTPRRRFSAVEISDSQTN